MKMFRRINALKLLVIAGLVVVMSPGLSAAKKQVAPKEEESFLKRLSKGFERQKLKVKTKLGFGTPQPDQSQPKGISEKNKTIWSSFKQKAIDLGFLKKKQPAEPAVKGSVTAGSIVRESMSDEEIKEERRQSEPAGQETGNPQDGESNQRGILSPKEEGGSQLDQRLKEAEERLQTMRQTTDNLDARLSKEKQDSADDRLVNNIQGLTDQRLPSVFNGKIMVGNNPKNYEERFIEGRDEVTRLNENYLKKSEEAKELLRLFKGARTQGNDTQRDEVGNILRARLGIIAEELEKMKANSEKLAQKIVDEVITQAELELKKAKEKGDALRVEVIESDLALMRLQLSTPVKTLQELVPQKMPEELQKETEGDAVGEKSLQERVEELENRIYRDDELQKEKVGGLLISLEPHLKFEEGSTIPENRMPVVIGLAILMSAVKNREEVKSSIEKLMPPGKKVNKQAFEGGLKSYDSVTSLQDAVVKSLDRFVQSGGNEQSQKELEDELREIMVGGISIYDLTRKALLVRE